MVCRCSYMHYRCRFMVDSDRCWVNNRLWGMVLRCWVYNRSRLMVGWLRRWVIFGNWCWVKHR